VPDAERPLDELGEFEAEAAFACAVVEQLPDTESLDDARDDGRVVDRGDAVLRIFVQRLLQAPVLLADEALQAEKEDPQPQVLVAFGFLMTNCAPSRPSV
jgi:hypothetical protein